MKPKECLVSIIKYKGNCDKDDISCIHCPLKHIIRIDTCSIPYLTSKDPNGNESTWRIEKFRKAYNMFKELYPNEELFDVLL